jgi:hypothetical protein
MTHHHPANRLACVSAALVFVWLAPGSTGGAPVARTRPEREIPLDAIYTTGQQKTLRPVPFGDGERGQRDLEAVKSSLKHCNLSTVFIVRGDDPGAAIRDARCRLTPDVERETRAERKAREQSSRYWLVLFLGIGPGSPNQWTIRSVEVYPERVQVTCDTSERNVSGTTDVCYYLYLIPLGELKKGRYSLQLSDAPSGDILLLRKEPVGGTE